jgi:hypothetical protein
MKRSILHKEDVYHSWKMGLNGGLDASFESMQGSKGGEVSIMKAYLTNDVAS